MTNHFWPSGASCGEFHGLLDYGADLKIANIFMWSKIKMKSNAVNSLGEYVSREPIDSADENIVLRPEQKSGK